VVDIQTDRAGSFAGRSERIDNLSLQFGHVSFAGDVGVLDAFNGHATVESTQANVAADAAVDFIDAAFLDFLGPIRIGDQLAAQGDHVDFLFGDQLFGQVRIMDGGADDRDLQILFEFDGMGDHAGGILGEELFSGFIGPSGHMPIIGSITLHVLSNSQQFILMNTVGHMLIAGKADTQGVILTYAAAGANQ